MDNFVNFHIYFIRVYFIVVFASERVCHRNAASKCDQSYNDGVLNYIEKHAELW